MQKRLKGLQKSAVKYLGAEANDKHFKLIFLDIGLGQRLAGLQSKDVMEDPLRSYEGRLAEQFVGQQLLAESDTASEDRQLYYWKRQKKCSTAEVDFLLVRDGHIIPVEVKSGKSGSLKSLHLYLSKYGGQGLCLQETNEIKTLANITFLPLCTIL